MKKFLVTTFVIVLNLMAQAQELYKRSDFEEYKLMLKNGVVYQRTGKKELDSLVEKQLAEKWTCTSYKVVDADDKTLTDETVLLVKTTEGMSILQKGILSKNGSFVITESMFNMNFRGFCNGVPPENHFVGLVIQTMNQFITYETGRTVGKTKEELKDLGHDTNYELSRTTLPLKAKLIKEKTLLLIAENSKRVNNEALAAFGVKTKSVSLEEYLKLTPEELKTYCLFYFLDSNLVSSCITIYDLADGSIIFTQLYYNEKDNLSKKDLEFIAAYW